MKQVVLKSAVLILLLSTIFTACSQKKEVSKGDLKTIVDSASYCIGSNMGSQFKGQNMDINPEILMSAFYAAYDGDTNFIIKPENIQSVMMEYDKKMQEKQKAAAAEKGKVNREKSSKFLADNKTKEGIQTTTSGLQYKVIKQGAGAKPTIEDRVRIQYRLKLIDGKVIESTFERGEDPVIMGMNGIIPGMSEGLQLMSEGSTFLFWISPELGYGDMDSPELPAGSLLSFEVQLIEVVKGGDNATVKK
ncbi:MAG: FKBP-type peptidyl-prolyl cis-trans isomerase [Bacteroidales bacterium]|nr:FKBP-type peptidyl-prolyl cis-trans isomerase [Bacteroidales bacterium]